MPDFKISKKSKFSDLPQNFDKEETDVTVSEVSDSAKKSDSTKQSPEPPTPANATRKGSGGVYKALGCGVVVKI